MTATWFTRRVHWTPKAFSWGRSESHSVMIATAIYFNCLIHSNLIIIFTFVKWKIKIFWFVYFTFPYSLSLTLKPEKTRMNHLKQRSRLVSLHFHISRTKQFRNISSISLSVIAVRCALFSVCNSYVPYIHFTKKKKWKKSTTTRMDD